MICTYPSDRREAKKTPSLQDISDRLQRLESLLLEQRNREPSTSESLQAKVPDTETPGMSNLPKSLSTIKAPSRPWEILLKDGERVHYVDNANLLDLFQDEERLRPPDRQSSCVKASASRTRDLNLSTGISQVHGQHENPNHLYPDPQLALRLWKTYIENVDPVVKVLHIPTTQSSMIALIADPSQTVSSFSALAFAVYFAATTSLTEDEISSISPENRSTLLERFKNGLNQIIIELNLFNEPDVTTIEAIAIFATCLRVHDPSRGVWILIGTAIRLAQSIGIHRYGAALALSPFETERRLRLWWHLNMLDSRAPEDHGFAYSFDSVNQGLRLPLNVNDNYLFPEMETLPLELETWTQASFAIVSIETTTLLQRMLGPTAVGRHDDLTGDLIEKRKVMREHNAWLGRKFFSGKSPSRVQTAAAAHHRTAYIKMEFMLQAREHLTFPDGHKHCSTPFPAKGLCEMAFRTACRAVESSYTLLSGTSSARFAWLFQSYPQWYALAYVLRFLCAVPLSPETEDAWVLVNKTFDALSYSQDLSAMDAGRGSIWRCLARIRHQVAIARGEVRRTIAGQRGDAGEPCVNHAESGAGNLSDQAVSGVEWPSPKMPSLDPNWNVEMDMFGDALMPDMLCLPEWSDIVNGRLGL
ncbi:fungal-specific transcription factor domain-containing protein [Penicillium atrosanguineum]|uniref:Fungal-specific transcription factor domain-containing protein n=1 Tax=Penicillium atrosanguineum TaxID=1132637 RepID=A0A9W9KUH8_9EURO|nr:Mitotic spindle checkpoint component mad2 [Penicillium atrosanguineum]KAJ5119166.1 fungal-specific transcription factor domain-containing protein [Penicillium atrosanguineum]KAJ5120204.1 fungal-specific transcription factor domain-containing protein [Penicillium atrosanguineum]KAJ5297201.1 Mitotic spindle checkpoint component mad2 [Penicillium atrosanguineum]KAJ5299962.1 fungal-specific transcription factor domain-containing protein [Penicillium atrosanguineum]